MNQINPDLNEVAERVCGFLGCRRDAGDVELTVSILNDFGIAQEMQLRACALHEMIVNALSAAKCVRTVTGGGGDLMRGAGFYYLDVKLYDRSADELKELGVTE